jgi:hypothetical protein
MQRILKHRIKGKDYHVNHLTLFFLKKKNLILKHLYILKYLAISDLKSEIKTHTYVQVYAHLHAHT